MQYARKIIERMGEMITKKKIAIIILLNTILLAGCQASDNIVKTEDWSSVQGEGISGEEERTQNDKEIETEIQEIQKQEKIIDGMKYVDGREVPINVTMILENVQKGEEAYKILAKDNRNISYPKEGEEYMIATFSIIYNEGEVDELFMLENRASLQNAGLYFTLSNGESNAQDMTTYLDNSIYNLSIVKGQRQQGSVAFLHKESSKEPLYFVGFGEQIEFMMSE